MSAGTLLMLIVGPDAGFMKRARKIGGRLGNWMLDATEAFGVGTTVTSRMTKFWRRVSN